MVIYTDGDWISFVQINNIKVTIDSEICLFFSEPKSFKSKLEFNRNISDLLLIKFGVPFWASALDEKFVAIKFLFTYSPILSKLMKYDNISDIKIIDNIKDYPSNDYYITTENISFFDRYNINRFCNRKIATSDIGFSMDLLEKIVESNKSN